ncbi:OmpP1/FadL family transporter [Psychroflexus halocasei]|uniref:Outer membrane protein transport protein (OMPP1/FadL/TodX) n=1 Tax=Psychroflexus halocasei TaxID=908615 RepID=A0A1H3X579_9FLAO|nr:outer membrane protein transport protein [Psychroflexus halocasei]SDZ93814.1 Outer membrane protein transport protein (OMPP1/FadL/TodX) [Psychroflexus halocasei]
MRFNLNILYSALFIFSLSFISKAQEVNDALILSTEDLQGTPRFTAMGGAFGALGGDLSALKINPAGSAVFALNQSSFSLDFNTFSNDNAYRGTMRSSDDNSFDVSQAGAVFVFKSNNENAAINKFAFGVNYERTSNINNAIYAEGQNNQSIGDYFVNKANGIALDYFTLQNNETFFSRYDDLLYEYGFSGQEAYLAYESFLIDPIDPSDLQGNSYQSNVNSTDLRQAYNENYDGNSGKISFNGALDINQRLKLGMNVNATFSDYTRFTRFNEQNSSSTGVNKIVYDNILDVQASGISLDFGAIYNIHDKLRFGVSYETPTWMSVSEKISHTLRTRGDGFGSATADPEIFNVFPDYKYKTPGKWTGSLAMIFNKNALLSIDYSRKDFTQMKFRSNGFEAQNAEINDMMQVSNRINVGGEYRIDNLSLRAGYSYVESPYKDDFTAGDINRFSAGLGYTFGMTRVDLSYVNSNQERNVMMKQSGINSPVNVDNQLHQISLGFAFMF